MSIITKIVLFMFVTFFGLVSLDAGLKEGFGSGAITMLGVALLTYYFIFKKEKIMPCTWCGGNKLKLENKEKGEPFWAYRNKDGSPDMRVRGNHKVAGYNTFWRCRECGALTNFWHNPDRSPSRERDVIQTLLAEPGKGERIGKEYVDTNSVFLKKENREGS